MSIKGSLLTYENNNDIVSKSKKRSSVLHSTHFNTSITSTTTCASMGKTANSSLNSSISNSVITSGSNSCSGSGTGNHHHSSHPNFQQNHLPAKYMNSKRKHAKYNNMYSNMYPDHNNYLHLNSLWSIWYGVLLTLFQGYLAVHGAYRFLGCSLIAWKIEPVAELNLQIILSGLVFILLPFFFTSAVFKVGNMANDGIKLATGVREQRCSMSPHDGLEEESRGGTLRALWTHGGPTAAFIHIVIAMCLLLPRLLLEARIIENGLLPRETIWQTELDFMSVNRRHLVVLSVLAAPYQNDTHTYGSQEDDEYFNDTIFSSYSSASNDAGAAATAGSDARNSLFDTTSKQQYGGGKRKNVILPAVGRNKFLELPDLLNAVENQSTKYKFQDKVQDTGARTTTETLRTIEATQKKANRNNAQSENDSQESTWITIEEDIITTTPAASTSTARSETTSTRQPITTTKLRTTIPSEMTNSVRKKTPLPTTPIEYGNSKLTINNNVAAVFSTSPIPSTTISVSSFPHAGQPTASSAEIQQISNSMSTIKQHQHHRNSHNGKSSRKHNSHHHRQRKVPGSASTTQRQRHHNQYSGRRTSDVSNSNMPEETLDVPSSKLNRFDEFEYPPTGHIYEHRPSSYEELDFGRARAAIYPKSSTTISTTTRDSNIHIVKPEKLPEIVPSTPVSSNSKIIEIKSKANKRARRQISSPAEESQVEIEPEYLIGDLNMNDSSEYLAEMNPIESSTSTTSVELQPEGENVRLDGFAGMLQLFFGIEKPIDVSIFTHPPSAEFINLVFALLVWCVRYPAVFWTTAKSFATIFSVQMIATASDIIFSFVGISNLFKLQIYSEAQPIQNPGLILNATVTLALFLLSTVLMLSSSMIMYLYGHGRLASKMRDRSIITLKSGESWIYFAHCASLCYVLALSVVKAPLLNDLSATYRHNLHCPTFMAALVSVMHIMLWIVIWLCLTIKRRWSFKLPPLDAYTIIGKATTQPLLMHNRGSLTNTTTASLNNSTNLGGNSSSTTGDSNAEHNKSNGDQTGNHMTNATSSDMLGGIVGGAAEDVYWPKLTPSSPKLKVTFNEVTSTSDDDHHRQQNDGKRNSPRGTSLCFTSAAGEIDDGEYATLRSATAASVVGIAVGSVIDSGNLSKGHIPAGGIKVLRLSEYEELPPPPQHMISSMTISNPATAVNINNGDYVNCSNGISGTVFMGDDNISEEGKLLACVRDDSVTYASARDLEPPLPPPPPPSTTRNLPAVADRAPHAIPEIMQLSSSSEHLVSPLAPVTVTVHTNEAHITSSSTPRCLRRADSGVPQEALTPRSDTTSTGTESTISPPERAPSESSSGVHSAEEREVEVVIRPRVACKPPAKPPPPAIQEEPYGRCTNMRMSSFTSGPNVSSATLPLQRSQPEQKFDYSQHCSTMPLPINGHSHQQSTQPNQSAVYATSTHCMTQSLNASYNVTSFKTPLYANTSIAMTGGHNMAELQQQQQQNNPHQQPPPPPPPHPSHTTLPNGVRYSNPNILRRLPYVKGAESPYGYLGLGAGHHAFSKPGYENSLLNSTIPEDRDSANYSMTSDQDCLYATANPLH